MRRKHRLGSYIVAGLLGAAAFLGSPVAGAEETTKQTATTGPVIDSAAVVEQVRADLAAVGIHTAPVDDAVTDAVDQAVDQAVTDAAQGVEDLSALVDEPAVETTQPAAAPYVSEASPNPTGGNPSAPAPYAQTSDPNYRWQNDPVSKVLAGDPLADHVLHRVSGSWFDAPRIPEESVAAQNRGVSLFGPGTPVYIGDSNMCTLGVVGTDAAGRKVGLTAGHCGQPGDRVSSADSWQVGPAGTVVASNPDHDYAVIEFGSNAELTRSYNGVTVNGLGGAPATPGQQLCKQGVATGFTCGVAWSDNGNVQFSQVCASVGDSGGPMLAGDRLVGLVSGGSLPNEHLMCRTPLQGAVFMPTVSTSINAVLTDLESTGGPGAGLVLAE